MRRRAFIAAFTLTPFAGMAAGPLRVVASFSILADMVRQVGGDAVLVEALVGPDGDVHVYEPRPKDLHTLLASGLLVRNGLGLEGWMDRLTGATDFRGTVVVAADKVTPRTMQEAGGAIATDPHAWQDPRNAVLYVQAIAGALASVDAPHAGFVPGSSGALCSADQGDRCVDRGDAGVDSRGAKTDHHHA